jgi:hypothetical protein
MRYVLGDQIDMYGYKWRSCIDIKWRSKDIFRYIGISILDMFFGDLKDKLRISLLDIIWRC